MRYYLLGKGIFRLIENFLARAGKQRKFSPGLHQRIQRKIGPEMLNKRIGLFLFDEIVVYLRLVAGEQRVHRSAHGGIVHGP